MLTIELKQSEKQKKKGNNSSFNCIAYGKELRETYKLDEIDISDEHVMIDVSKNIHAIGYQFFNAMFGKSVRTLGPVYFKSKYRFNTGIKNTRLISDFTSRAVFDE